jgi:DNA-binding GntR family transcriptional regulator
MGSKNGSGARAGELSAALRTMIVEGELPPGIRVPERDLCERFAVSRTPLREALKILSAEGHVTLLPNRGARVATLTLTDVRELFEVSGALEALAGELACARATDADVGELATMTRQMVALYEARDLPPYYALNRAIHERIVTVAGSATLSALYQQVSARIRRARFVAPMTEPGWALAVAEHEGVANALQRRDGAAAAAILKTHLSNKGKDVVAAGFAVPDEPPGKRRGARRRQAASGQIAA